MQSKCAGRTFDPRQVDLVELRLRKPTQLDHLLQRDALLTRLAALARRAELLDLGQEALDSDLDILLLEVGLGRAKPSGKNPAVRRAFGGGERESEDVRQDSRADEGLDDTKVVVELRSCRKWRSVERRKCRGCRGEGYVLTALSLTTSEFAHTKAARGIVRGVGRGMGSAARLG